VGNKFFGMFAHQAERKANKNCSTCGGIDGDMPGMVRIGFAQDDTLWGPCPECFSSKKFKKARSKAMSLTCEIGF